MALILALLLSILVEVPVAALFGYWRPWQIAIVALINVITNPPMNYLLLLNYHFGWVPRTTFLIAMLEIAVVFVEWRLLLFAFRQKPWRLLALSATMNFCSYVAGVFLFG